MKLKDKIAIVTGGARGIGAAIVERFVAEGARVVVADLLIAQAEETTRRHGDRAFAIELDVTKQVSIDACCDAVVSRWGGIDILVNNAGIFDMGPIVEVTEASWDRQFAVNTKGLFFMLQAAAKRMIARGQGGKIINFSSQAGRRGEALVSVYCASKAAVISVDRNQLANALLNLALNARDAMPDGGQLTIATKCQPVPHAAQNSPRWPTGEEVCIVISDTGVGMTDDVRGRAFEPFFTTTPDGLGSGLGLSMVQGFVEQSGGTIDIESAPGSGTTITIRLPRIASESQADETDLVAGAPESAREKTVLLVEDDPDVRVVTAAQLRHLGYKVHAVANGMEAIDLIASPANIDITLTDIVLPGGLDGVALVKEAMRARPKMGVLCMSGYNPTEKHRKWLKVQNIAFLEKPFSSAHLAQALDAALVH